MSRLFSCIACLCMALVLCSCATTFQPTRNLEEALAGVEDSIPYHDRAYMEARPLNAPTTVNIERLGNLKYAFAFDKYEEKEKNNVNQLTEKEWSAFKREFENAIAGSRRFPVAQLQHGLADKKLREGARNGANATPELDVSQMVAPEGILHLYPTLSVSESLVGKEKTITNTFKLACFPTTANNAPLNDVQSFSITVYGRVYQLTDRFGRGVAGFRFNTSKQLEDYHLRQGRAAIVKFFVRMYEMFPVGGKVTGIDEDGNVTFTGNRSLGLQPKMECIVFAVKKGDPQGAKIALYNATAVSVSQTGTSMLQIWRKSEKKGAKKIIKKIEADFDDACGEYDFYACADSFAQWPDFIDKQNTGAK